MEKLFEKHLKEPLISGIFGTVKRKKSGNRPKPLPVFLGGEPF
jgi:hypothetical protein